MLFKFYDIGINCFLLGRPNHLYLSFRDQIFYTFDATNSLPEDRPNLAMGNNFISYLAASMTEHFDIYVVKKG